jgi:transposase InsO family protein
MIVPAWLARRQAERSPYGSNAALESRHGGELPRLAPRTRIHAGITNEQRRSVDSVNRPGLLYGVDLFRCESFTLRSYWVLVVMDQCTRHLVGTGMQCTVTAADVCRVLDAAIHGQGVLRHLSTDHDPLFESHRWTANRRILEIDEIKSVPHVPLSHPFVERLIGTMRRECLDQVLFWNWP